MPPPRNRQRPRFRLSNYDRELLQAVHDRRLDRDDPEVQAVLQRVEQAPAGEPWQTASVSMQPEAPPPPSQFESDLAMTRAGQAGREGVVSLLPRSYSLFRENPNAPTRPDFYSLGDMVMDFMGGAYDFGTQRAGRNPYTRAQQAALSEQGLPTDPRTSPLGLMEATGAVLPAAAGAAHDLASGRPPTYPNTDNPETWRSVLEARGAPEWAQNTGTVVDWTFDPADLAMPGLGVAKKVTKAAKAAASKLVKTGDMVGGLRVRDVDNIPNLGSISASLGSGYEDLGVRSIPMSRFSGLGRRAGSVDDLRHTEALTDAIKSSGEITPLIVVEDSKGLYVLEGGHRADALARLGVTDMPALVVRDVDDIAESTEMITTAAGKQVPKGIRAYHGSPHSFDQFSMDKIGTGEGQQAYGHGLYFADSEDVARSYERTLSGADYEPSFAFREGLSDGAREKLEAVAEDVATEINNGLDPARAASSMRRGLQQARNQVLPQFKGEADEAINAIDQVSFKNYGESGTMSEVNLRADPSEFLDWDKPLRDQSAKVREAVEGLLKPEERPVALLREFLDTEFARSFPNSSEVVSARRAMADPEDAREFVTRAMKDRGHPFRNLIGNDTGGVAQERLSLQLGPRGASEALRSAGVPGATYINDLSVGAEGARNYVMFDDKLIDIMKKYGVMLPAVAAYEGRKRQTREPGGGE